METDEHLLDSGMKELPIEIWNLVMEYATHTADVLQVVYKDSRDTDWSNSDASSSSRSYPFGWRRPPPFDSLTQKTKSALCLVCREFYVLAKKHLYETIYIRSESGALRLRKALLLQPSAVSVGALSLLQHLPRQERERRLDPRSLIKCIKVDFDTLEIPPETIPGLARHLRAMLPLFTHLEALLLEPPCRHQGISEFWARHCGRILREIPRTVTHLEIDQMFDWHDEDQWLTNWELIYGWHPRDIHRELGMSSIQRMRLNGSIRCSPQNSSQSTHSFVTLRELYAQGEHALMNAVKWDLTSSLTRLSISDIGFGNGSSVILDPIYSSVFRFWATPKPSLEYLFLDPRVEMSAEEAQLVFSGLPNLRTLEYYALSLATNPWPLNWGDVVPDATHEISIRTFHDAYGLSGVYTPKEEQILHDHLSSLLVCREDLPSRKINIFCPSDVNMRSIKRLLSEVMEFDSIKRTGMTIVRLRDKRDWKLPRTVCVRNRYPVF